MNPIMARIVAELKKRRIRDKELCSYIGISQSTFATWKVKDRDPKAVYLPKIAKYLGVSLEYLLCGTDEEEGADAAGNFDAAGSNDGAGNNDAAGNFDGVGNNDAAGSAAEKDMSKQAAEIANAICNRPELLDFFETAVDAKTDDIMRLTALLKRLKTAADE